MSDVSQGPGWWLASDGKWYSPEQAPGVADRASGAGGAPDPGYGASGYPDPGSGAAPSPTPAYGTGYPDPTPAYGTGYPDPAYGTAAYPAPASGAEGSYGAEGYGPAAGYVPYPADPSNGYLPGGPYYGYAPSPKTNGLAIAAMVCSFFFWIYGVGAVLGVVFGFIARSQIKRSGGTQQGEGMALAGIIIGFVGLALGIILVVVIALLVHHCNQTGGCNNHPTFNASV